MVGVEEGDPVPSPGNAGAQQERGPDVRRKPVGSGSPKQHVQRAALGGEQQVKEAVPVVVGSRGSPHPRRRLDAPSRRALGERSDAIVRKDLDRTAVIHHQEVHVPIVIPVGEQRKEAAPRRAVGPGLDGHIRETPVPVVPIEAVRGPRKIVGNPEDLGEGIERREGDRSVVGDLDVEVSVVIEIGEGSAHRDVVILGSRGFRQAEERPAFP